MLQASTTQADKQCNKIPIPPYLPTLCVLSVTEQRIT